MDLHRLAEQRSLAIHREIAARISADPALVERARETLGRWQRQGTLSSHYVERWQEWLAKPADELATLLTDDGEEARALRQTSPFVGIVGPRERWAIWRRVREQAGR